MVVKVVNPECVEYIRRSKMSNTETVERIICEKLGIAPRNFKKENRGNEKIVKLDTAMPVKILDDRLVRYITNQKAKKGIPQRYTVETAILKHIAKCGA